MFTRTFIFPATVEQVDAALHEAPAGAVAAFVLVNVIGEPLHAPMVITVPARSAQRAA